MKKVEGKQFKPTSYLLDKIFQQYGLNYVSYKPATSGIENTTLIVETTDTKYVLRVYRQANKSTNDILLEVEYTQYLRSNGISTPKVIKNSRNKYVTEFEENSTIWQLILMEFIGGEHATKYSHELIKEIANVQASMHLLSSKYSAEGAACLTELNEDWFIKQINRTQINDIQLQHFLKRAENYRLDLDVKLPKGLCHLDYDNENVLSKNDKVVAVLDFDDIAVAPFIVCLGYTLWHILFTEGNQKMHEYLEIYEYSRALSHLEWIYLYKIILFRHYVISSMYILNGQTTKNDIKKYLSLEGFINEESARIVL